MIKQITLVILTVLLATGVGRATLYTETFNSGGSVGAIPEGNPVGVTFGGAIGEIPTGLIVGGLTVDLNISGGYNGGLFAYLVAPNGTTVTLLNEPGVAVNGFGASGPGMNITLSDAGGTSIQSVTSGSVLSGTYSAAGSLSGFNGSSADGSWTLFFADLSSGGGIPELLSWSLDITAVPEPVRPALVIFLVLGGLRWWLGKAAKASPGQSLQTPRGTRLK